MVAGSLSGSRVSLAGVARSVNALARTTAFFLKVLPMLPSRPVDWLTRPPLVEKVTYPVRRGTAQGDLYRPTTRGPHPGMVVCLGVVPFGVDHPQVPRLGQALARSGFAALMCWSPAMRDRRLDPEDIGDIALAYQWLVDRPSVDAARSGLLGTCVGGSFALMAAASPLIRDRVGFVAAFAPYSSMWTFGLDIACATRSCGDGWDGEDSREPWPVDPLTRDVYVRSLTAVLDPCEADRLRAAFLERPASEPVSPRGESTASPTTAPAAPTTSITPTGVALGELSDSGRAIYPLLEGPSADEAAAVLRSLPPGLRQLLDALSPLAYLPNLRAPLIAFGQDRDDLVIPVGESRRLRAALAARSGVHYTEFGLFQHADPTKLKLPPQRLR